MSEYIYLIRNGDLCNIGVTESLAQTKKNLEPGILEASLQTSEAKSILRVLQNNYSTKRLPQSNYFRLSKSEYIECKIKLKEGINKNSFKPIFSGATLIITFLGIWFASTFAIIRYGIQPIINRFD